MSQNTFDAIIRFAITKEIEAADFYHSMQSKVKSASSVSFLKELEAMENGHIRILQNFDHDATINYQPKKIMNLQISDFMVDPEPNDSMTQQEVIVVAMKREDAANKLYLALADESETDSLRNIFLKIADEEAKHKLMLETMYDEEVLKEN